MDSAECLVGRMKTRGLANRLVNHLIGAFDVNGRARRRRRVRFFDQIATRLRVEKVPLREQIKIFCRQFDHGKRNHPDQSSADTQLRHAVFPLSARPCD